jgi:predicted O-methyltransferase YrrM
MEQERWSEVDSFITERLGLEDEALNAALGDAEAAGLPSIQVSPPQGRLLQMLVRMQGARRVLEFGTLGGYSTIWMARALGADDQLISLEANPEYAEVARASIDRAGVGERVEIRVGPALETLQELAGEGAGAFDFVFIDADKVNTPNYFAWAVEHARPGAVIVADNVVRGGTLAEAASDDPATQAQRRLHEEIAADPRLLATTIQTVGGKSYDGFTIAWLQDD